jgi:hypothetical protein
MRTVVFGGLGAPTSPSAYPVEGRVGLLGEMPVRLCAGGGALAAYGVGGQLVEIPASSIRQVWIHPEFEGPAGERIRPALLVLDARHRVLLRAPGIWGPGVPQVCHQLGLNKQPVVLGAMSASRKVLSVKDADGCKRLRVRRRGGQLTRSAVTLGQAGFCLGGYVGGVLLGLLLPASVGDARILLAVLLGAIGALAGARLYTIGTRFAAGLIRWAVASRRAGTLAPARPFLRVSGAGPWTERATLAVLAAAVPVLAIWGIAIEAMTLSRGGNLSHGAALGNVVAGALAILLTPLLARVTIRRFQTARNRVPDGFTNNLA